MIAKKLGLLAVLALVACKSEKTSEHPQANLSSSVTMQSSSSLSRVVTFGQIPSSAASVDALEQELRNSELAAYLHQGPLPSAQKQAIYGSMAVLVLMTDAEMEEFMSQQDPEGSLSEDQNEYYPRAVRILDSLHIPHRTVTKRYLEWGDSLRTWTLDLRTKGQPMNEVLLFKPGHIPRKFAFSALDPETVKNYMKQRKD